MFSFCGLCLGYVMYIMWKEKTENCLTKGERRDTYLTHVCRLLQSVKCVERIDKKLKFSANTVTFVICRNSSFFYSS
jgi:hypothetical protein